MIRRALGLALLCGAAFALVAALVRAALPWPPEYGLAAKWEHFRAHKDEYDAVVLGTSRVFRGVDTPRIEQELAARGVPLSIFNFGVAGMRAFEEDRVLREVLALEPARLRWVLLEGGPWSPEFRFEELTYSSRSVFWHDAHETLTALVASWRAEAPWTRRLRLAATHLDLFLWRLASYGQGRLLLADRLRCGERAERRAATMATIERQHGFQSADEHTGRTFAPGREELLAESEPYRAQVAAIEAESERPVAEGHLVLRGVREQRRLADAHGVRLVYVVQPGYEGAPERTTLWRRGEIETLLDFDRPERWPELFALENRYDEKHLNRRGAEVFAPILASALAELIEERR